MTAIKATAPSASSGEEAHGRDSLPVVAPSATEVEAKTRYAVALGKGVTTLLERGYGRERVSNELMNEIADGCAPDEEEVSYNRRLWDGDNIRNERPASLDILRIYTNISNLFIRVGYQQIFKTMETIGISLEDATKVMTVSTALRKAQNSGRSTIEAIDELTSRLNMANLLRGGGSSPRSSSPIPSAVLPVLSVAPPVTPSGNIKSTTEDSFQLPLRSSMTTTTTTTTLAAQCQRPPRNKGQELQQGKGRRKRALTDKTPEKRDPNVLLSGEQQTTLTQTFDKTTKTMTAADIEAKEKIKCAKLSKTSDGGKGGAAMRAKSPEGARGKRSMTTSADESTIKRPRTRSMTQETLEETIPEF